MIIKVTHTPLSVIFSCFAFVGYTQVSNQIVGQWKAEDESKPLQMEIYFAKDGNYYGKVINDKSNPTKNGTIIVKSLKYNQTSKTYKGTIHPPDTGVTLNVTITAENPNRFKLVAKKMLLSKIMYLTRIK